MPISPDQIWQTALGELQLQLTGATFDTWLAHSSLVGFEGGAFTIGVHNQYAKDWLETRLVEMIKRTLAKITGQPVEVQFVVYDPVPIAPVDVALKTSATETSAGEPPSPKMPELEDVGYFPVSRYECMFWAPLLGRVAWRVWEIVRGTDIRSRKNKTEWTPERRWSAPELARIVPCGSQAIVGVNRTETRQDGALDRLAASGVGRHRRQGDARDPHTMYVISVRVRPPLLSPVQVMGLADTLRHRHDRWLEEHGFDPREWFIKEAIQT